MERFNVKVTDGRKFETIANLSANSVKNLSEELSDYLIDLQVIYFELKKKHASNMSEYIAKGSTFDFEITYLDDDVKLSFKIKKFGLMVANSTKDELSSTISMLAQFQEKYGHIFSQK